MARTSSERKLIVTENVGLTPQIRVLNLALCKFVCLFAFLLTYLLTYDTAIFLCLIRMRGKTQRDGSLLGGSKLRSYFRRLFT